MKPPSPARKPHSFWVIMDGNTPTAFRAREREDLIPTFVQLQRTQPGVELKWFERNRIWSGPGEAREALMATRGKRGPVRPDWRPGGEHKDPRKRYELTRDQKRARFKTRQRRPDGPPGTARPARPPKPRRG